MKGSQYHKGLENTIESKTIFETVAAHKSIIQ